MGQKLQLSARHLGKWTSQELDSGPRLTSVTLGKPLDLPASEPAMCPTVNWEKIRSPSSLHTEVV